MTSSPERRVRRGSLGWWTSLSGVMTAVGTVLGAASLIVAIIALRPPADPGDGTDGNAAASTPTSQPASTRAGPPPLLRTPWLGLEFYQGGQRLAIYPVPPPSAGDASDTAEVEIGTEPLEIRTPALPKGRGMRICAWLDDSIFGLLQQDQKMTEESAFGPGHGMADTSAGSGTLFLDNEAFNYFDEERVAHLSDRQDAVYVSSFEIRSGQVGPRQTVYLAIWVDRNGDEVSDLGEYEFVILRR